MTYVSYRTHTSRAQADAPNRCTCLRRLPKPRYGVKPTDLQKGWYIDKCDCSAQWVWEYPGRWVKGQWVQKT